MDFRILRTGTEQGGSSQLAVLFPFLRDVEMVKESPPRCLRVLHVRARLPFRQMDISAARQ
jgi:hypothetical protein